MKHASPRPFSNFHSVPNDQRRPVAWAPSRPLSVPSDVVLIMENLHPTPNPLPRGFPDQMPFGWFFIAYSDDLAINQVQVVFYFGQEWVIFRNGSGQVGMIEPYCPHLGAHLGFGGKVDGTLIRCPFHAWGFDKDGYCRNIPYARKCPSAYQKNPILRSLPLVERSRLIWAWYHPSHRQPLWPVEAIPEVGHPEWTGFETFEFEAGTSVQDILENSVDYPHFSPVHGHTATLAGETAQDGIHRQVRIAGVTETADPSGQPGPCAYSIEVTQTGPGQQTIRYRREVELLMLFLLSPVTAEKTVIRLAFLHRHYKDGSRELEAARNLMREKIGSRGTMTGIQADLPIWNHKIYRECPLLCDGDGPILPFRAWFRQFYAASGGVEEPRWRSLP